MVSLTNSYKLNALVKGVAPYLNNIPPQNNIMIFSDPRGGSTWLAEILRDSLELPVLWEPLFLRDKKNRMFNRLGFGWRQEIPDHAEWAEAYHAFDKLFRGKVLTEWTTRLSKPTDFIMNDALICKFCRANGMAVWLTRKFQPTRKPIVLVRHPLAVAASQLKHGPWAHVPAQFDIPNMPYNERYYEHWNFLASLSTQPERLVAQWCITNASLLKEPKTNTFCYVFYERLLENPERELRRIFTHWNLEQPENIQQLASRASSTVTKGERVGSGTAQLQKWKSVFDKETIDSLLNIMEYFEIEVYSDQIWPNHHFLES